MPFHISWGALFAGAAAALGVWILLYALGVALGLSTVNPDNPDTLRASGVFTGIWGLVTPLVALFVGGLVAGRSAGALNRGGGALHGLVVWSLTALGGLFLVANLLGGVLGTAVKVGQNVATRAITEPGTEATAPAGGVVGGVERAIDQAKAGATENLQENAAEAAPKTGRAFWVVFGALLLGALASIGGGALGVTREQRRLAEAEVIAGTEVVTGPPMARATMPGVAPVAQPEMAARPGETEQLRAEIAELRGEIRELIQQNPTLHH